MENIGLSNMMKELKELNPEVEFDVCDYSVSPIIIIIGTVPATQLSFPDGYYWNEKNGITNKHNTGSGLYECFTYKFDRTHFVTNSTKTKKKSLLDQVLDRLFGQWEEVL